MLHLYNNGGVWKVGYYDFENNIAVDTTGKKWTDNERMIHYLRYRYDPFEPKFKQAFSDSESKTVKPPVCKKFSTGDMTFKQWLKHLDAIGGM